MDISLQRGEFITLDNETYVGPGHVFTKGMMTNITSNIAFNHSSLKQRDSLFSLFSLPTNLVELSQQEDGTIIRRPFIPAQTKLADIFEPTSQTPPKQNTEKDTLPTIPPVNFTHNLDIVGAKYVFQSGELVNISDRPSGIKCKCGENACLKNIPCGCFVSCLDCLDYTSSKNTDEYISGGNDTYYPKCKNCERAVKRTTNDY